MVTPPQNDLGTIEIVHTPNLFHTYLIENYSNPKTIKSYEREELKFWNIAHGRLNQHTINIYFKRYGLHDKKIETYNSFYKGFMRALLKAYKIDHLFKVEKKDKSRSFQRHKGDKFLSYDEVQHLINNTPKDISLIIRLLFETGLRANELLNIKLKDINMGTRHIKGIGKGNKEFRVHFSDKTGELLTYYLHSSTTNRIKHPEKEEDYMFIFLNTIGLPLQNQHKALWDRLRRTGKRLGIENLYPHKIRHSLGRYLKSVKGWDFDQVRVKLRHSTLETTKIYAVTTEKDIEQKEDQEVFNST